MVSSVRLYSILFLFFCINGLICGPAHAQLSPKWQIMDMKKLTGMMLTEKKFWTTFIDDEAVMCGLYLIPKGTIDDQHPLNKDEVYYVVQGKANIEVEGKKYPIQEKSVVYVEAGSNRRFTDIEENMLFLVIFSKAQPVPTNTKVQVFQYDDLELAVRSDKHIWNPFLEVPTLTLGLYELPKSQGGEDALTNEICELYYVIKGEAEFTIAGQEVHVAPGSIMYLEERIPHHFFSKSDEFEMLVFSERAE